MRKKDDGLRDVLVVLVKKLLLMPVTQESTGFALPRIAILDEDDLARVLAHDLAPRLAIARDAVKDSIDASRLKRKQGLTEIECADADAAFERALQERI